MADYQDPTNPSVEPVDDSGPYGYRPKLAPAVVFTLGQSHGLRQTAKLSKEATLLTFPSPPHTRLSSRSSAAYALLTLTHLGLTIRSRQWWLIVLAVGAGFETAGNALRVYGHYETQPQDPYIAMQVLVVVTPVFFAAIHFAVLGKVIQLFGREFTVVAPKVIIPFFVCLDVVSLVIQGAGSGIAATQEIDGKDPQGGSNVVVGGLSIQLLGYVLFDILAIIFATRAWRSGPPYPPTKLWTDKTRTGLLAAFASALLVLLRSSFRTAEMAEGWDGYIAATEWYYYVFDATPVTIAVLLLAIWHPAQYLPRDLAAEARALQRARDVEGGAYDSVGEKLNTVSSSGAATPPENLP